MYMRDVPTVLVAAEHQEACLVALTSAEKLAHGDWYDPNGGNVVCPMAIMVFTILDRPIDIEKIKARMNRKNMTKFVARIMGITEFEVEEAYSSWDEATDDRRQACVRYWADNLEELRRRTFADNLKGRLQNFAKAAVLAGAIVYAWTSFL